MMVDCGESYHEFLARLHGMILPIAWNCDETSYGYAGRIVFIVPQLRVLKSRMHGNTDAHTVGIEHILSRIEQHNVLIGVHHTPRIGLTIEENLAENKVLAKRTGWK